jgi:SOS-response transcriptional repressor LexA
MVIHAQSTGFQSQAHDYMESPIDLSSVLNLQRPGIYPVRVDGTGFEARGIRANDILIVDTAAAMHNDALVVVFTDSEIRLARMEKTRQGWHMRTGQGSLFPGVAEIWGMVTGLVRETV